MRIIIGMDPQNARSPSKYGNSALKCPDPMRGSSAAIGATIGFIAAPQLRSTVLDRPGQQGAPQQPTSSTPTPTF
ncbi:hypothetical protein ACQP1O_16280 [Nocardia sp. CA-151230]|uniref:hypothetical protein n=1 Tax=Nocardia sp. CA-151230 TaxID=3239982 RepID=UPI003D8A1497